MSEEDTPTADPKKKVVKFPKKSKREPEPPPVLEAESPPKVNPAVVEYLATLLEQAKRGEIQAFGFASVCPDHIARHSLYIGGGEYQNSLVAAVAYLSHELIAQNMAYEDEELPPEHNGSS
jgi:hypothetical protein